MIVVAGIDLAAVTFFRGLRFWGADVLVSFFTAGTRAAFSVVCFLFQSCGTFDEGK